MDITNFLSKIFLFESLSKDQIELVEASTSMKRIAKSEHLFMEGQLASAFFIIVSGKVKIYKLSVAGNEQILHIQTTGDLVAEAAIFDRQAYPAFCQALEDTLLIRISKDNFLQLLRHHPEITFKIMSSYSRRLRQFVAMIEELLLHDIKSRTANHLITNSTVEQNQNVYTLSLSKKDLASVLGTIPETLSRTLQFFKKEKIISEQENKIIILNPIKLKSFI